MLRVHEAGIHHRKWQVIIGSDVIGHAQFLTEVYVTDLLLLVKVNKVEFAIFQVGNTEKSTIVVLKYFGSLYVFSPKLDLVMLSKSGRVYDMYLVVLV